MVSESLRIVLIYMHGSPVWCLNTVTVTQQPLKTVRVLFSPMSYGWAGWFLPALSGQGLGNHMC